ncbi:pectinesterase QRT1-like [Neltuma alba]|uniref:pectinesterase QRT1-like n=1 Tax=Neltuma alba TaxID=207710 RepID=UPI0010A58C3D|nr:pectinesterase QRT1-like [Prosopis alba]
MKRGRVIVVDQDGRGNSTTVQGAIDLIPVNNGLRMKILIYPGIYNEIVEIPQNKPYISMIGRPDTRNGELPVITSSRKASDTDENGNPLGSMNTATVFVQSDYFVAAALAIENSAVPNGNGDGDQALAIRIDGDKSVFYRMRFLGYQDTLMDNIGTHFFYQCYIQGSVDFICGSATSLYQDCTINSTNSGGAIAAHERNSEDDSGFIFEDCRIQGNGPTFLGRAWGNYSRIIYSFCRMDDIIQPPGWSDWDEPYKQNTAFFGEYMNEGPGSNRTGRVSWSKSLSDDQAVRFVGRTFIKGNDWLKI